MIELPGYRTLSKIFESSSSQVYRAQRLEDACPVIFKLLKFNTPCIAELTRYRQEYEITRALNSAGAIKAYGIHHYQESFLIVLEDIGGEALSLHLRAYCNSLERTLNLAIAIADALAQIHEHGIIHKDINPSNIVYNPANGLLKIIDFGIATRLPKENPTFKNSGRLEGTLAYMAPEQTGRMNRVVDQRADLYAFGVTLFEMLTGQLPFPLGDEMDMVHSHIAVTPPPPTTLIPTLPSRVTALVLKLMAKTAEERYQSALGVKADLQVCLSLWLAQGSIPDFPLGQHDRSAQFQIPQQLYGREPEIQRLLAALERVSQGHSEVLLVAGYSGIGKTALVATCYKPLTRSRGYFISGKYDQYQRNTPYSAVVAAFRDLVQQLLTESEARLRHWKELLLQALGPNGQVIVEVIPEVELVIGLQPPVEVLGPNESQNRFGLVFQNFIRAFCAPEHPLVIFLDDLQWADTASLKLISLMMANAHALCCIGAYRDNEVSAAHPLLLTLEEIKQAGARIETILLRPLEAQQVIRFVADTVHRTSEEAAPLAQLVMDKTQGNPFFMGEFLKFLHSEQLLRFDSVRGGWDWDVAQIRACDISDNVVELMAGKILKLPAATQAVLKLAACIGNRFSLHTLTIVYERTPKQTLEEVWEAMHSGFILPLNDAYKRVQLDMAAYADPTQVHWKFAHDRIQQAVYSLIPDAAKQDVHYRIGQLLLANIPAGERGAEIFAIVDQLNVAIARIPETERQTLARLNLDAGCKAKNSAAYGPAYNYLATGIDLLGAAAWQTDYALCLALHDEITEAAFLRGDFPRMQCWSEAVLQQAHTLLDKLSVYELRIQGFMARNQQIEAVRSALEVLKLLGVSFPNKPTLLDTWVELARTRAVLLGRSSASIMALPRMTDPQQLAIMRILASIWSAAYQAVPPLMPLLVFKMVRMSIRHGNSPQSVLCYAWYGLLLCGVVGDIPTGYRFGELALKLLDHFEARQLRARLFFVVNCFVRHWKEPAAATLAPSVEAYRVGLETGALEFAAYAAVVYCYHSFIMGRALPTLQKEMALYCEGLAEIKQEISLNYTLAFHQATLNLTEPSDDPGRLIGSGFDEAERILQAQRANDRTGLCFYYFNKMVLYLIFDHPDAALANAELARQYLDGVPALYVGPACVFYDALARVAAIPQALPAQRKTLLRQVRAAYKQLQAWAVHAPHSYQQKALLIRAELARVLNQPREARELYDQAIAQARAHEFRNEEALACELAARFYVGRAQSALACHYWREAHTAYLQWGATAKAAAMEQRYPEVFVRASRSSTTKGLGTLSQSSISSAANFLDIATLMKASHAISGEIVLDRLIEKLLTIVLKNAGAQQAWLLLEREGGWTVVAQADSQTGRVVLQTVMLEALHAERPELPVEILQYVIRTRKPLVLSDARQDNPFSDTAYIIQKQPQSVLCSPILHQGRLGGLLYLENNLLPSAFTENHLATLDILSAQIAISIENALYYRKLEAAHRAEQARIAAEAASQAKSDFLAHMSHELRTPLNAVLGYAQLMQRDKTLNDEQIKGVTIIRQSGEHLLSLINDILDLSKIEAGKLELAPTDFNLGDFVHRIAAPMTLRAKEKGLSFIYKEDSALPEGIHADERRLRQVFFNLLGNALKFTDQGGVTLRVGFVHETLSIAVEDTGCGIAQDELEKIFLPFHQTGTLLHRQQGTGLGLPITRRLIEAMGGKLVIESRMGQGSVFRFTVAAKALTGLPAETAAARAAVVGFEGAERKLLIVDDNTQNRLLLQSLLQPLGFAMAGAEDGLDALQQLTIFRPDLILMDLVMPKMDGFECTRRIRQHPEYQAVPIILISASMLNQEQQDFVSAGCNAFLLKPVQLDALLDELARLLGLKWVYARPPVPTPQQSQELSQDAGTALVIPSAERLRSLYDLTLRGDIQAILAQANSIVSEDAALAPFAKVVAELAKSFQERRLQAFIKQYLDQG